MANLGFFLFVPFFVPFSVFCFFCFENLEEMEVVPVEGGGLKQEHDWMALGDCIWSFCGFVPQRILVSCLACTLSLSIESIAFCLNTPRLGTWFILTRVRIVPRRSSGNLSWVNPNAIE